MAQVELTDPLIPISRILFETPEPFSDPDFFPRAPLDPAVMPLYPFVVVDGIPLQLAHENEMGNRMVSPDPLGYS